MDDVAAEICTPVALTRLLERQVARHAQVDVALACGSVVATASSDGERARAAPIGCIAKLLTATLVARAVERGELEFDASAGDLLGVDVAALRGVTVRHLLEHTHGLDDSLLAPPLYHRGRVDGAELLSRVGALVRWSSPGLVYSYGNLGAWLLSVILERLHGDAFAALVHNELLAPLRIEGVWSGGDGLRLCAATGSGLALTAAELARFALHVVDRAALAAAPIAPLPGWHPLERGICLGWKCAGAGWFGHQSAWPGASCYLRVQPQREVALAVVARAQAASLVALGVFGSHFPDLFEGRMRLETKIGPASKRVLGVYSQAARIIAISATQHGLSADAWERDEHGARTGTITRASLVRIGDVLFAQPASDLMPYLEVVYDPQGSTCLWNGRFVLPRAALPLDTRR